MEELNNEQEGLNTPPVEEESGPKESRGGKALKIVLTVVICVVLLAVMLVALLLGTDIPALRGAKQSVSRFLGISTQVPEETEPQETEPEETSPADSYTVDEETARAMANNVVATAGTAKLTNSELQIYYQMYISDFVSQYGMYLSYMGIDFSKPLDQQMYDEAAGTTWQDFFLGNALQMWHQYSAIKLTAEAEGYELEDRAEYEQKITDSLAQMQEQLGYASVAEMLEEEVGAGTTEEVYRSYMMTGYYVINYMAEQEKNIDPTAEQLEAYYQENESYYLSQGLRMDDGDVVDVRHVLIQPENGTVDEATNTTVYTDEAWEACRQKAQELYDGWLNGEATEESFAELAQANSVDGNASEGGLYEQVTKGYMVETFNDWIFDDSRKTGDSGLVKTQFGYHIMYFVKREQVEPLWIATVKTNYLSAKLSEIVQNAAEQYPIEVEYDAIGIVEAPAN